MFLPRCDVICASITEQTTEKWNLFVLYNKYMKKYISKDLLNFRVIKKDESRQLTRSMIYRNQVTSLACDIAVRSVIGLHKSGHVSDVICAFVLL